jgi:hypothetical protein
LPGLSEALAQSMWDTHGPAILSILDLRPAEAAEQLRRCPRLGPKLAEKFKTRWDASFGVDASGKGSVGLRVADLLASPPVPGFSWGPDTRCYSPSLHQVGEIVARLEAQPPPSRGGPVPCLPLACAQPTAGRGRGPADPDMHIPMPC